MTCARVLQRLEDWPGITEQPAWGAIVRHTGTCRACRAELVALVVLAERLRMVVQSLPGPPDALRRTVMGEGETATTRAPLSARVRLARIRPYLPPLLCLVTDPWALVPRWLPQPVGPESD